MDSARAGLFAFLLEQGPPLGRVELLRLPSAELLPHRHSQPGFPDLHVAMAAYGDYGPGYIGTEIAYEQGGYETSPRASNVAPQVEAILTQALQQLLKPDVPTSESN